MAIHQDDHGDFGGLHRNLLATGAAMGRRAAASRREVRRGGRRDAADWLRGATPTSPSATATDTRRRPPHRTAPPTCSSTCSRIPEETPAPILLTARTGQRAQHQRRGAQRHPLQLRRIERHRRRRPADGRPDDRFVVDVRAAGRTRGLSVALRPARPLLALLLRGHQPELPAWRSGGRRQRPGDVHLHFSRLLFGPLAAHSLRGVPEPPAATSVGNKVATSQIALPKDACDASTRRRATSRASVIWRRSRWRATLCSATARRSNSPPQSAALPAATRRR